MTLRADSPVIDSPLSFPIDAFPLAPDRQKGQRNKARTPPGESCLRCNGLLVPSYMAALESDVTGKPMKLWRCINCGDCLDSNILADRCKRPITAREIAVSRAEDRRG